MSLMLAALVLLQTDGEALVRKVVANTREQKSFETVFKAQYAPAQGNVLDYSGRQVYVAPGVLYLGLTGSAGLDKKVLRAGDEVWVHHPLNGWMHAAENGDDGAARGFYHPLEVLDAIARNAAVAKIVKPGVVALAFSGNDLQQLLKNHVQGDGIVWNQSTVDVGLVLDAEQRLKSLSCAAVIVSNAPGAAGNFRYSMGVDVVSFNGAAELKFTDEKDRPIPLTPIMKEKLALLVGEKK
jgi:hypothetical protein